MASRLLVTQTKQTIFFFFFFAALHKIGKASSDHAKRVNQDGEHGMDPLMLFRLAPKSSRHPYPVEATIGPSTVGMSASLCGRILDALCPEQYSKLNLGVPIDFFLQMMTSYAPILPDTSLQPTLKKATALGRTPGFEDPVGAATRDLVKYCEVEGGAVPAPDVVMSKVQTKLNNLRSMIGDRQRGKSGRIRKTLGGKRTDQSGRAVIVCDPLLPIDVVGIPCEMAATFSVAVRVIGSDFNESITVKKGSSRCSRMSGLGCENDNDNNNHYYMDVRAGGKVGFVTEVTADRYKKWIKQKRTDSTFMPERAVKRYLEIKAGAMDGMKVHGVTSGINGRLLLADNSSTIPVSVGDILHRPLHNGDLVVINRAPSLHKTSLMAMRVRIVNSHAVHLNPGIVPPLNADFDGDEINVHVPSGEVICAELSELMLPQKNIINPQDGSQLIGPCQDAIRGLYLLSSKDTLLSRPEVCQLLTECAIGFVELMQPAFIKPVVAWTGTQVISAVIRSLRGGKLLFYGGAGAGAGSGK